MVHSSFGVRGGAERYVRDLARALTARGHVVTIHSRPSDGAEPGDRPVPERVSARLGRRLPRLAKLWTHLGDLFDPTGLRPADLREVDPDVVHLHNWQGLGVLPLERLLKAYPAVHSVHDHAVCDPNNALGNLGRSRSLDRLLRMRSGWIMRRLRRAVLLFPSERTRRRVRASAPRVAVADRVVPLAVPNHPRRAAWSPGRRDIFLYLGVLDRHKGLDLLLDAWREAGPATGGVLLIAGDGPLRPEVERLAASGASVRYLGYLDTAGKEAAFAQAGWLVFPSRCAETFGLVCAEALIAGRPVLASAVAAPPMASDRSVLLFEQPEELAALLRRAAGMPDDAYTAMTASALDDGRRLDWDRHVDTIIQSYQSVLVARAEDGHLEVTR
ncbi:glycosyltransferase [Micromonospora terminaliae]|uniref:Glycosyltransferase n=2 Tax=Micromonospora terminaliae TaxID=1914461 RepID=A0AAJ2ZJ00_9ACTN|nr:glycosyltransferase [Micromonospora terminaliae]NES30897.1 glycosyltransferase family 4 protein [Micromonospora terminaliae]QGL51157.1 glycosyltransferase [Micromonospora terminaliae]